MADKSRIPTLQFKVFRGDELLKDTSFSEPSVTIGSSSNALLVVEDDALGDMHCVINIEDDGSVQLLDLGVDGGTVVNGREGGERHARAGRCLRDRRGSRRDSTSTRRKAPRPPSTSRPDVPVAAAPPTYTPSDEDDDPWNEQGTDVMELVMRSGTGSGTAGVNTKAPKVLEVNQIWSNVILDSKHFEAGSNVTIGDAVGFRWSLVGVPLGWVPGGFWTSALRVSPPIWSDVRSDWRNDFYASDDSLPTGEEFNLFVGEGKATVARIYEKWDAYADIGDERFSSTTS